MMVHDILTEDFHHLIADSEKKTDQYIPEGFLRPLYSKEICPEYHVMDAMKKIESNIESSLLNEAQEAPVVFLAKHKSSKDNYKLLQQWEGVVQEIDDEYFVCQLRDLSGDEPDETAEIFLEEVSDNDRSLITAGAFFYWNIGYYENKSGQRTRSSMIRFRRLPAWTNKELNASKKVAAAISEKLNWGSSVVETQRARTGT